MKLLNTNPGLRSLWYEVWSNVSIRSANSTLWLPSPSMQSPFSVTHSSQLTVTCSVRSLEVLFCKHIKHHLRLTLDFLHGDKMILQHQPHFGEQTQVAGSQIWWVGVVGEQWLCWWEWVTNAFQHTPHSAGYTHKVIICSYKVIICAHKIIRLWNCYMYAWWLLTDVCMMYLLAFH